MPDPSLARTVSKDAFREALAPTVEALRKFTAAIDDAVLKHGGTHPWDGSPGMAEISEEQSYASKSSWENPVSDTHMLGGVTLRAATDYTRTFAEVFSTPYPPVYGHLVLVRAALEACVISSWLSEIGVGTAGRVKRGLSEQIYSAREVWQLKIQDGAADRHRRWVADAKKLGFTVTDYRGEPWKLRSRGNPRVNGVGRPSVPQGITQLVLEDATSRELGKLVWGRLSAVAHVTWFGLESAMMSYTGEADFGGHVAVPWGTDSSVVNGYAFLVMRALRRTAMAHLTFRGWGGDEWTAACREAEQSEAVMFKAYVAGQPADG